MKFSSLQIHNWTREHERELCAKFDLICERISLALIKGTNEYELPNYITNIRQVLYKGRELKPKDFRAAVTMQNIPFQTAGAAPFEYIVSEKGLRVIKLLPTPNENIAEYMGDLWTPAADTVSFIIEFYRVSSEDIRLPDFIRRYLLKNYLCSKAFSIEGKTQDLRGVNYYTNKMAEDVEYIRKIKSNMYQAVNYTLDANVNTFRKPGRPVLPPNFGTPVW